MVYAAGLVLDQLATPTPCPPHIPFNQSTTHTSTTPSLLQPAWRRFEACACSDPTPPYPPPRPAPSSYAAATVVSVRGQPSGLCLQRPHPNPPPLLQPLWRR